MQEILLTPTPFNKEPDERVITGLQNVSDPSELKYFQFEFYTRYAGYVYKAALHHFRLYDQTQYLASELLQKVFIKAFEKIGRFAFPAKAIPSEYTKIIKAWLGKIAFNESRKVIGQIINDQIEYTDILPDHCYDQFDDIMGAAEEEVPNEFQQILQEAMNQLSKKELDVILTYAGEGCINSTKHLSKNALRYLCEYYETTPEAIRQCKKRALDKIKKHCFKN
ncbi:MAG: sigma-70 family RNA polymerase sigma factor [Bacteroidota bacterium]|nr:sigma-70 family RNA polymerase sigma factor [Bacteroidota bacterium]